MTRSRWAPAAAVALVAAVALLGVVRASEDDDATNVAGDGRTTSVTEATTPTTPTTAPPLDTSTAVWPWASTDTRYVDPVEAARGFAVEIARFADPIVGDYRSADAMSGEVEVRATDSGPVTTVFVRQLTDRSWWVLGSASGNIVVEQPTAGAVVTSPVHLAGRSRAFEARVDVTVLEDGSAVPLGRGYVLGSGDDELRPFAADHAYDEPRAGYGAIVFSTTSAEDGGVLEASVMRVRFGDVAGTTATMKVTVWFTDVLLEQVVPVRREVPQTTAVLRAAVEQLLRGPTTSERQDEGLSSWFSDATAGLLHTVDLDRDGRAIVDLADLRRVIPNAATSAGSELLLSQLDATVFQFETVTSVEYRIDGSCETFFEWLQLGCAPRPRDRWDPPVVR